MRPRKRAELALPGALSVLIDTSAWSQALRRQAASEHPVKTKLSRLIEQEQNVYLLGVVLQELLSGVRAPSQYKRLKAAMAPFSWIEPGRADYEDAAQLHNHCRAKGVQAGTIDALIASVAIRRDLLLLTADRDFEAIAKVSSLRLL